MRRWLAEPEFARSKLRHLLTPAMLSVRDDSGNTPLHFIDGRARTLVALPRKLLSDDLLLQENWIGETPLTRWCVDDCKLPPPPSSPDAS